MSVKYNPSIVTDSLILHYDPANKKSYPQQENLFVYSQGAFNNTTYWPKINASYFTITDNTTETSAPDGTFTASKINVTTTNADPGSIYQDFGSVDGLGTYTFSIYMKGNTSTWIVATSFFLWSSIQSFGATINPVAGAVNINDIATITDVGNGWKRYTMTGTGTGSANNTMRAQFYLYGTGITYFWGAQIERGNDSTPYTPTTTAQIVRPTTLVNLANPQVVDVATATSFKPGFSLKTNGIFDIKPDRYWNIPSKTYNFPEGGTVDTWVKLYSVTTSQGLFAIGSGAETVNLWFNGTTSKLRFETAKSSLAGEIYSPTTLTPYTWYHIVGTFDLTTIRLYINGIEVNSATTSNQPWTITTVGSIGSYVGYHLFGEQSAIKLYNRVLTAKEVLQNFDALKGRFSQSWL